MNKLLQEQLNERPRLQKIWMELNGWLPLELEITPPPKPEGVYPIPLDPTWDIVDSSKLNTFLQCPRRYFFEYMLGWQSTAPNNHLRFGEAWHVAMEHILLNGYDPPSLAEAFDKLLVCYRQEFPKETDELYSPKTPTRAMMALAEYADRYRHDLDEFEVLYTEISGTVPIGEDAVMYFRLDSIVKGSIGHKSFEHKTKGGSITALWGLQWLQSLQIGTYNHVLYCLYPENEVDGISINGAGFLKTKFDFQRIPIKKTKTQMQVWLDTVRYWRSQIRNEMEILRNCSDSDDVLNAFPLNPSSCDRYFGCPFLDYCQAWANPLRECDELPLGFKIDFWNPTKKPSTHKMDLTKTGEE